MYQRNHGVLIDRSAAAHGTSGSICPLFLRRKGPIVAGKMAKFSIDTRYDILGIDSELGSKIGKLPAGNIVFRVR